MRSNPGKYFDSQSHIYNWRGFTHQTSWDDCIYDSKVGRVRVENTFPSVGNLLMLQVINSHMNVVLATTTESETLWLDVVFYSNAFLNSEFTAIVSGKRNRTVTAGIFTFILKIPSSSFNASFSSKTAAKHTSYMTEVCTWHHSALSRPMKPHDPPVAAPQRHRSFTLPGKTYLHCKCRNTHCLHAVLSRM